MTGKTVVVLGGGTGGIVAANSLRVKIGREHKVVLVERNALHAFAPSFLWLMTGKRQRSQITCDLHNLVRPGVEIVCAEVTALDLNGRRVATTGPSVAFDYLVVAFGAELDPESVPGLSAADTFYTLEGAGNLHLALNQFTGGKVIVLVSAMPYKCPGAPHEAAMLIADFLRRRGAGDRAEIHVYTPEPQPMPVAGPELGEAVKQMLAANQIAFHPLHKLSAVNPKSREVIFEGQLPVHYDLLAVVPPHRGSPLLRAAGLANESGWVPVERAILQTKQANVYAIGDATAISIPGRWKADVPLMLPKAGVFAHAQGEIVAQRIAAEIEGSLPTAQFTGMGYCALEAGGNMAGFADGNFFAEPSPQVRLRKMGRTWHVGKVLFEQWWLSPFGLKRELRRLALLAGGKTLGIPMTL